MPGISGAEVIRAARQARPDLPTVLMTGYADADALGEDFRHVVLLKDRSGRKTLRRRWVPPHLPRARRRASGNVISLARSRR
jgi:CheY-like chemotaxis protein